MAEAGGIRPARERAGRPVAAAALVAGTVLGLALAWARAGSGGDRPAQFALLAVILGAALAARRVPLVAGGCCLATYAAYGGWGYDAAAGVELPLVLALFLVGLHGGPRVLWWLAVPTALVGAVRGAGMAEGSAAEQLTTAVVLAFLCSVPLWTGVVVGRLREDARRQRGRAERAARLADLERAAGVAQERARIARELHDSVAHHLSVMVVQAGAARRVLATDPAAAQQALEAIEAIEAAGRRGLTTMPSLVRALRDRDGAGAPAPQPSLARLDEMVAAVTAAGLPVGVRVDGDPRPLPPGVELSTYRVIQESLTNVLKHAGPARADVRIAYRDDALDVTVVDDGFGPARGDGVTTCPGHGLLGMRERVHLFGGEFQAGGRPGGGFAVHARFPLAAGTA